MTESKQHEKRTGLSLDWLVGGVLSKLGESLDRITGRGWNPSSSLATSKLIEKLKFLLDEEAKEAGSVTFAPHIITLKIQWNKFAADSDDDLESLTDELHAAAIDHINDKLYHTYGPIKIEIKNDYFTEGVRLIGSFGEFGASDDEAAVNVTLPNITVENALEGSRVSINLDETPVEEAGLPLFKAVFELDGMKQEKELDFGLKKRFSIGRGVENDLSLEHNSVSQVHASLVLNGERKLLVADTGSTNGTYVLGNRIPYGKALEVANGEIVRFGAVSVEFQELRVVTSSPFENELPAPAKNYGVAAADIPGRRSTDSGELADPGGKAAASISVKKPEDPAESSEEESDKEASGVKEDI